MVTITAPVRLGGGEQGGGDRRPLLDPRVVRRVGAVVERRGALGGGGQRVGVRGVDRPVLDPGVGPGPGPERLRTRTWWPCSTSRVGSGVPTGPLPRMTCRLMGAPPSVREQCSRLLQRESPSTDDAVKSTDLVCVHRSRSWQDGGRPSSDRPRAGPPGADSSRSSSSRARAPRRRARPRCPCAPSPASRPGLLGRLPLLRRAATPCSPR